MIEKSCDSKHESRKDYFEKCIAHESTFVFQDALFEHVLFSHGSKENFYKLQLPKQRKDCFYHSPATNRST